jgi:hypothetical protein
MNVRPRFQEINKVGDRMPTAMARQCRILGEEEQRGEFINGESIPQSIEQRA